MKGNENVNTKEFIRSGHGNAQDREREQRLYVGGGSGTNDDPYTLAEFDMMCADGTWNGNKLVLC